MLNHDKINSVLGSVDPDLRPLIASLQSSEPWVHKFDDVDKAVYTLSELLPDVVKLPISNSQLEIVDKLIFVLAHLEVDVFFVSMLYLQRGSFDSSGNFAGPGWGSFLHSRSVGLADGSGEVQPEASVVVGRMTTIMRSAKLAKIFLQNSTTNAYRGRA